jgi:hypothetical protein
MLALFGIDVEGAYRRGPRPVSGDAISMTQFVSYIIPSTLARTCWIVFRRGILPYEIARMPQGVQ